MQCNRYVQHSGDMGGAPLKNSRDGSELNFGGEVA
jgi:hypothetical protein